MKIYQAFSLEQRATPWVILLYVDNNNDKTYENGTQITNVYNK